MNTILFKFFAALVLGLAGAAGFARAEINVVTTTSDLRAVTDEVGGGLISVDAIGKGTQDPHFLEAKPSFMVKANRADLLISVGLDLEIGWLPNIVQGARNPRIVRGQKGFLEIGNFISPLEIRAGTVTRAEGDVHPFGNPHFWLDPIRIGEVAVIIAQRLGEIDFDHRAQYMQNARALQSRLQEKTKTWQARVARSGVQKAVSYHKTLSYFYDRFQIENPIVLEPKPGIPPTSGHIIEVIQTMKQQKIPLLLIENFFDPSVTERIKQDIPDVRVETIAVSVGGAPGIDRIDDLYETLVTAVEKGKGS